MVDWQLAGELTTESESIFNRQQDEDDSEDDGEDDGEDDDDDDDDCVD